MDWCASFLRAGAKERGELENRVTQLVQETKDVGNVVLMIDELHLLVRVTYVSDRYYFTIFLYHMHTMCAGTWSSLVRDELHMLNTLMYNAQYT